METKLIDMDTKRMRVCAPLLPAPGDEVVAQCLGEIERLREQVRYLRHYGNRDCTVMADAALQRGELDATLNE